MTKSLTFQQGAEREHREAEPGEAAGGVGAEVPSASPSNGSTHGARLPPSHPGEAFRGQHAPASPWARGTAQPCRTACPVFIPALPWHCQPSRSPQWVPVPREGDSRGSREGPGPELRPSSPPLRAFTSFRRGATWPGWRREVDVPVLDVLGGAQAPETAVHHDGEPRA